MACGRMSDSAGRVGWEYGRRLNDPHHTKSRVERKRGDVHAWVDDLVDALLDRHDAAQKEERRGD